MARDPRARVLHALDGSHPVAYAIMAFIALNVTAVILESIPSLQAAYRPWFEAFEWLSLAIFSVEYVVRVWAAPGLPKYAGRFGRLRYATSLIALIDLIAILPSLLLLANLMPAVDLRAVRIARFFRFARLLRVLKLGRYSTSAQLLGKVVMDRRSDLGVALAAGGIVLVLTSSLMYAAEHEAQPEHFSSIPAATWWSVVALTTTGYGDVVPVTTAGRILAAATAVVGVMIVALPAAILASGFMEEIQSRRAGARVCPHCGKDANAPVDPTRVAVHAHPADPPAP